MEGMLPPQSLFFCSVFIQFYDLYHFALMNMQITRTQISCRGTLLEAFCTRHIKRSWGWEMFFRYSISSFPNKNRVVDFFFDKQF